jgi:tellurite resistance protein TerC
MPPDPSSQEGPLPDRIRTRDVLTACGCLLLALGFAAGVCLRRGSEPAQQFAAGYLIELSLSADNVFIFALVFEQFRLDPRRQRVLLFWGVAGAMVLRSVFLLAGIGAIARFSWIVPVFGAVLLAAGLRFALSRKTPPASMGRSFQWLVRIAPAGFAALFVVEAADFIFALDSLPAVLAVTHDPAIAIASNLFAILGLRSLYFVISGAMRRLPFLNTGVAVILAFVGAKMVLEPWIQIPTWASLAAISGILAFAVAASLSARKRSQP